MTHRAALATSPRSSHEVLDARILRSLGERRAMRMARASGASAWDGLEAHVTRAATLLWETSSLPPAVLDDLLAFCAYLARELEVTESLDLDFSEEFTRLQMLGPATVGALDAILDGLEPMSNNSSVLLSAFRGIRSELAAASAVGIAA